MVIIKNLDPKMVFIIYVPKKGTYYKNTVIIVVYFVGKSGTIPFPLSFCFLQYFCFMFFFITLSLENLYGIKHFCPINKTRKHAPLTQHHSCMSLNVYDTTVNICIVYVYRVGDVTERGISLHDFKHPMIF